MTEQTFNWQAWGLAIRPRTLPAAAAGVVMGGALAWHDGFFRLDATLVCLFAALLLQIGSNLANDVFDFERGTDTPERLGPTRVTQAGLLTSSQVKLGMAVVFVLSALMGLYLIWLGGWVILAIGIAAIISAIAYTGGPFPLGYYGLGDVFVFIFFGLASVAGTYYVQAGDVSSAAWWMTLPPGLIITAILVVNNLRDLENDRKAGKYTLAVMFGEQFAKAEYLTCIFTAYLILPVAAWFGLIPWLSLMAWASFPIAFRAIRTVFTQKGRPLNAALASTGQAAFMFSLLFWIGLALQR
ncbi:MAG TPA: 1,4-dihydroxy-2-naphthoate polyprenyltransferase [Anaerolineales bacterium]|nr:1,4-dihydroxy-2-naphthoate polyprenyltransferase [Anaerolineales bacterium]HNF36259.1 1,4-dihydroxy-2-naphthoate polyprenyltransferase [Anaerolineales bacterium]HNH04764.1 1,4-dihydroxy-2-naphthoate polyprenyltransferase [Anaerolineales bacterium]